MHGRRNDFFQGGPLVDLSKSFSTGGQKWWNLVFTTRNWENSIFCWNFQIPAPLQTSICLCVGKVCAKQLKNTGNSKRFNTIPNSEILLNLVRKMKYLTDQFQLCFSFCIGNAKYLPVYSVAYEAGWRPPPAWKIPPPRLEKFRANSVFRASQSFSKILKDKKYFNTVKNSRAVSVFQGKRRLFKILKDKQYIQYGEFRAHSVFQGKQKLRKHPESKKCIKYSEKFHDKLYFQGKRKFLKSWKIKIFQCSEEFQGKLYFSGHAQVLQNSEWLKIYIYIQSSEFRAHSVFQGKAQVAQKSCKIKNISTQWKVLGQLCFSEQESCLKIWMIKNQWRAVRGGKKGSSSPTIFMKCAKRIKDQNNKLNTNLSFHVEKVQVLYDSNLLIVNTSEFSDFFFTSEESHEGRQRLLVFLSPGGFRIEQFVTNCGGERLPYNHLYVSSITFMSVTV